MPPDTRLPDRIIIREPGQVGVEEVKNDSAVKEEIAKETGKAVEGGEGKETKEKKEAKKAPKKKEAKKAPKKKKEAKTEEKA